MHVCQRIRECQMAGVGPLSGKGPRVIVSADTSIHPRLSSPAIRCIGPGPIRVYYEPSPSDTVALKMVSGLVENFTITTELLSNEPMNLAVEALELGGPTWRERKHLQPSRRRKVQWKI
ncbi:hypothetical protein Tco_0868072 [Tanacetum coccineum]